MMMIAFITFKSSLVPLFEGLWSSNSWEFEVAGFRRNRIDDLGIDSPSLWPTEPRLHVRSTINMIVRSLLIVATPYLHACKHIWCWYGWRRCTWCLIFRGHFPRLSPTFSGSFAERDLQLKVACASSPPCTYMHPKTYMVAMISRLPKSQGLFCKRAL